MSIMQIYERPIALDRNIHQELRINMDRNFQFARKCQSAILVATELNLAIKEFPVVFVKENENYLPAAILGLQQEQNLFVDALGIWKARYIPAFIRRYPFVPAITQQDGEQMTVCIDESATCVNRDTGEQLFIDGNNSAFLDSTIQFLQDFKTQTDSTILLINQLADAGLFSEKTANFKLNDGISFSLNGFYTIDTEKLTTLTPETTFILFQSGALHLAYLHISSLDNWNRLISLHAENSAVKPEESSGNKTLEHA